jgi:hypothetical protein
VIDGIAAATADPDDADRPSLRLARATGQRRQRDDDPHEEQGDEEGDEELGQELGQRVHESPSLTTAVSPGLVEAVDLRHPSEWRCRSAEPGTSVVPGSTSMSKVG